MALTGVNYYSDLIGLDTGKYSAYFDFSSQNELISGGNFIINSPSWCPAASGVLIGTSGNFTQSSGSGFFQSGDYLKIYNYYPLTNWSVISVFESSNNPYNKVLFSSFPSGQSGISAASSGYFCGINNANKLFFSHPNTVYGPQIYTYTGFVPSKSIICVNKQYNNLGLGVYNPADASFDLQQFSIDNGNIVINSDWYLGGAPSFPAHYPNLTSFSGYIDEFILLSGDSFDSFLNILPSGFFSSPTGTSSGVVVETGQYVYQTGIYTGYSGITGYINAVVGSVTDSCGNTQYIYEQSGVSGIISGIQYFNITGIQYFTGLVPVELFQSDIGFVNSLGMEKISVFYEILSGNDTLEYFANSANSLYYIEDSNTNNSPVFSAASNNWMLNNFYSPQTIPVYRNGQLQLESGYFAYASGYGSGYVLSGDYFINSQALESTGAFVSLDTVVTDYNPAISGLWSALLHSGSSSGYSPFSSYPDYIYVNGQKLTTGINITGNNILLNLSGNNVYQQIRISGFNSFDPSFNGVFLDTGSFSCPKFLKSTSTVFYNGIRQSLNNDYVECGVFDRLSGKYVLNNQNYAIYSNTNDFLNL